MLTLILAGIRLAGATISLAEAATEARKAGAAVAVNEDEGVVAGSIVQAWLEDVTGRIRRAAVCANPPLIRAFRRGKRDGR